MTFFGVDQSVRSSGVCRLADSVVAHLETIRPRRDGDERLLEIEERLGVLFDAQTPTRVAFEGYAHNAEFGAHLLGEVGGVVRLVLLRRKIPYVVVAPPALKKFATGDHTADKEAMIAAAIQAGAKVADDHQADAFWLAQVARVYETGDSRVRAQLEVIHALQNPVKNVKRRVRQVVKGAM